MNCKDITILTQGSPLGPRPRVPSPDQLQCKRYYPRREESTKTLLSTLVTKNLMRFRALMCFETSLRIKGAEALFKRVLALIGELSSPSENTGKYYFSIGYSCILDGTPIKCVTLEFISN